MTQEPTKLEMINVKGLHARAAAKFVETVEAYDASAVVSYDGMVVSGDSIMGLMMLGCAQGSSIEVVTSGNDAKALEDALRELVAKKFEEEEFAGK